MKNLNNKGYLHSIEAVVAGIILLVFALNLNIPEEEFPINPRIELDSKSLENKNFTYIEDVFLEFYPLKEKQFRISEFSFQSGGFNGTKMLNFTNSGQSAKLIVWLDFSESFEILLNEEIILPLNNYSGIIRLDLKNLLENNQLEINSQKSSGTYNIIFENFTDSGSFRNGELSYFYYGDQFNPVVLVVDLDEI